jgi:hypothetical protein
MTDNEFNLYMECRRQYSRVTADINAFNSERAELDNVYRIGSQPPLPTDYKWWERLLMFLHLRRPRATLIPSDRLHKYDKRLKYLDRVVERAEFARDSVYEKLNSFTPNDTELRFVDVCDRCDSLQKQVDQLRRLVAFCK